MRRIGAKLLSTLIVLVMTVGLLPLGHVVFAAGDLANVSLSPEGVLTWDDFSGAGCYYLSVGHFECTTEETTFNVKDLLDSGKNGSGTYSVRLYAMDKEPSDDGVRISSIWQKPYNYTSPWPQLSAPTNLKWTDNVGSWESVPNATKYKGRLWVDSFGDTSDPIIFETTSNSIDLSDYFVSDTHQYAFVVYATNENYIDSAYATSEWVTRTKDLPSLQNVSISSEGVLTWNAFTGATLYSWSYQCGSKSGGGLVEGTSVNIKQLLDEGNAPSGEYTVGLYALDKHPGSGGVQLSSKWWGEYDYVFSYVFTTQPLGGTVSSDTPHAVTWATNFTPVKLERYRDGIRDKSYDGDSTITSENITSQGTYKYRAWYGTGATEYVDSDEFVISPAFAFTTQPKSGTAKKSESYTFTWALNDTPTSIVLQEYSSGTWGNTYSLEGLSSYSVSYSETTSKYRIKACKGSKDIWSSEFTVTWTDESITAPTITTTALSNGKVGTSYNQSLTATGDAPITWSIDSGILPAGLTLGTDGSISGTPTTAGDYTFTVKATNSAGSDTKSYTVSISAADVTTYTISFDANSGSGTMADITVNEGEKLTLPDCTFTPPSTDKEFDKWDAGNPGEQVDISSDCVIRAIWKDKAVTPIAPTITTATLPNGKVGTTYNQAIEATGETPITWSLDSGSLPSGLTLGTDGSISGTPTTAGDYTFTVKATNAAGDATQSYTITIAPADAVTYTVTFDANGHGTAPSALTVTSGSTTSKPSDPTASGWTFGGWYQDATCSVSFDFATPITANITLYAKWTENAVVPTTYTVTFNTNGGSAVSALTVEEGAKATKPADPTKESFTFDGWYQDATLSAAFDFDTPITGDITLYAKWTENSTDPGTVYYIVVSGANSTWTEGDLTITVKRSEADETCFSHFTGVKIDGADLVSGTDFTAVAGSTVVTIKESTLKNLSEGGHTITVVFDDGTVVTSVTLKAPSNSSNNNNKSAIPATGETLAPTLFVGIAFVAVAGALFAVILVQKRKRA